MSNGETTLYSGGAKGAEACFGENAEKYGINEVNFSFEGHEHARNRGIKILSETELQKGDVSQSYVSSIMHRTYPATKLFKKILQTIWYQINSSHEIFIIGKINADNTVKGGTGWGAEFAKLCNKALFVYDQDKDNWYKWDKIHWEEHPAPKITAKHFSGSGSRVLTENGKKAIEELFNRSFAV